MATASLEASLTRDVDVMSTVHRSDERYDYDVKVTNTASPFVREGHVLTCEPTSQTGISPTYTYQWRRNGQLVAGATESTYTVSSPADDGAVLQCEVRATNGVPDVNSGGFAATSGTSEARVIASPPPTSDPPVPPSGPNGVPQPTPASPGAGTVVTCSPGTWSGVSEAFGFAWYVNGVIVPGETASTYTVRPGDVPGEIQCAVTGSNGETAITKFSQRRPTGPAPSPRAPFNVVPGIGGGTATSGPVTVVLELPAGLDTVVERFYTPAAPGSPDQQIATSTPAGWTCSAHPASALQNARATCTRSDALAAGTSYPTFSVAVGIGPDAPATAVTLATVSGGGMSGSATATDGVVLAPALSFGLASFATSVTDASGDPYTRAGGHPASARATFAVNKYRQRTPLTPSANKFQPIERVKTILADVPRGFVGNVRAIGERCPSTQDVLEGTCPVESAIGGVTLKFADGSLGGINDLLVYAIEPEFGRPAQFAFSDPLVEGVYTFHARLRPDDGYAITMESAPIPAGFPTLLEADVTICGFGANHQLALGHNKFVSCKDPVASDANSAPLVTLPVRCSEQPPTTRLEIDSWATPGVFEAESFSDPPLTECEAPVFNPEMDVQPTSVARDSASGLQARLSFPSDGLVDPDGVSEAHLKKTVVELPEGVSVNPSAATGLEACSDAELGLGTDSEPDCPDGSKIASVRATTPVLEEGLEGALVLRPPTSTVPESGQMFRMALIVRNRERGILVKLPGTATADPQTGRLVATFDENPELPIGEVEVLVKGGPRGVLAMPQRCGERAIASVLSPWAGETNVSAKPKSFLDAFTVGGDCAERFAPSLAAGNSDGAARGVGGTFSFRFSRQDGDQWLRGLTARLPDGLLASVKGLIGPNLCSDAQANAGSCPAASRIGMVDAKAGVGDPFVLEQKGDIYLTEGYKGGAYGLMVKIRGIAGPFRGEMELSPIVVRQAIHVDRDTAQVTAVSDPFPVIHHGVPLRVREVTVLVDRPGFMVNPSGCSPRQVGADIASDQGSVASLSHPFQVSGCAALRFKPRLALRLTGRKQVADGKHPGLRAVVRQAPGEAGMRRVVTRLPLSLALDPYRAQSDDLCEFDEARKKDPNCPARSIIGRARAFSPLLNRPLEGPVYFAKNVRIHPKTGNPIRTLPTLVTELSGEIDLVVRATTDTQKGKLVTTFPAIPDAPVDRFELNLSGGKDGILVVSGTNLCRRPRGHVTEVDADGHNGRRHDFDIRMKTPCAKKTRAKRRPRSETRIRAVGNRRAAAADAARAALVSARVIAW
jgi:hypothetical protein